MFCCFNETRDGGGYAKTTLEVPLNKRRLLGPNYSVTQMSWASSDAWKAWYSGIQVYFSPHTSILLNRGEGIKKILHVLHSITHEQ